MKYLFAGVIVPAAVIIPVAAAVISKSYRQPLLRVICSYLVFSGLINIAERIMGHYKINNLPLLHLYTIGECLFIMYFFYGVFQFKDRIGKSILWAMFIFTAYALVNMFFIQGIYQHNSYVRPVGSLLINGLCLYYFFSQTRAIHSTSWISEPINWMVTGFLVYFGSSLFHFAFLNIISEKASMQVYFLLGTIHASLVLVMYLLFTAGFIYGNRR